MVLAFFGVGTSGLFEVVIIKIADQKPATIICTQWIKPDVEVVISAQMSFDHLRRQWLQVRVSSVIVAVAGRVPGLLLRSIFGHCVDVFPPREVIHEERNLLLR